MAIIATVPYSIVRQPTDRNSGVLFFPLSLSSCACSGGERNSPSPISPCWREPPTERGHCTLFTCHLNPVRPVWSAARKIGPALRDQATTNTLARAPTNPSADGRFDRRPRENALRRARTNLIARSGGRKDADHKSGGPRYPLLTMSQADDIQGDAYINSLLFSSQKCVLGPVR